MIANDFPSMKEKHRISGKIFVIMAWPAAMTETSSRGRHVMPRVAA
jgi:hypothetical protein